jgi:hypothetical protein
MPLVPLACWGTSGDLELGVIARRMLLLPAGVYNGPQVSAVMVQIPNRVTRKVVSPRHGLAGV